MAIARTLGPLLEHEMSTTRRLLMVLLLSVAAAATSTSAGQRPEAPPNLDAYVQRAMKAFEVPGVGLAVVKDGAVVAASGYGVRKLGDQAKVDARTLFGIASNTKAFTATALALLVEEGRIAWDAPVIRYLPWFQMWDPFVTRELTVRDLLVHRSGLGLGAGDLLWWPPSTYNRREIAARLRFIPHRGRLGPELGGFRVVANPRRGWHARQQCQAFFGRRRRQRGRAPRTD